MAFGHKNMPQIAIITRFGMNTEIIDSWSFEGFLISAGDKISTIS